jgi:hypothetical protein
MVHLGEGFGVSIHILPLALKLTRSHRNFSRKKGPSPDYFEALLPLFYSFMGTLWVTEPHYAFARGTPMYTKLRNAFEGNSNSSSNFFALLSFYIQFFFSF